MRATAILGVLITVFGFGTPARAGDPCRVTKWWDSLSGPCPCCSDDYYAKPLPCPPPRTRFGCDDYCRKPMPSVYPEKCFGRDSYRPKPMPVVPACWNPPWFSCGCDSPQ
jgi:hypothetical protein